MKNIIVALIFIFVAAGIAQSVSAFAKQKAQTSQVATPAQVK